MTTHSLLGFTPKLITVMREGYGPGELRRDALAGLTVAIVALPLSMALAIASGVDPQVGLTTAIIAGGLISLLGGSRVQIGGPTGAFVVVVADVLARQGPDGLVAATFMAGVLVVIAGLCRFGMVMRFIPLPVINGFTAGIAFVIFSSQVEPFLALELGENAPADVSARWVAYVDALPTLSWPACLLASFTLLGILLIRRFAPRVPAFLVAVIGATLAVSALPIEAPNIVDRFGEMTGTLPAPQWPQLTWTRLRELMPDALTIAFLAGIESLLSAVVADGMTGRRHRPGAELVAQGIANIGSSLFGGLPATGAIARTATNVRAGGRSPVAGILHAVFVLLFMVTLAPVMGLIPLGALAAILIVVAWTMADLPAVLRILRGSSWGDRVLLLSTLLLTVLVDLAAAIEFGIMLAAILFVHRMAAAVSLRLDGGDMPLGDEEYVLPPDTLLVDVQGPLFFAAADRVGEVMARLGQWPAHLVVKLSAVPLIDGTGVEALRDLIGRAGAAGGRVTLVGAQPQVRDSLTRAQVQEVASDLAWVESLAAILPPENASS